MKDYKHIKKYENILDTHREKLEELDKVLDEFENSLEGYENLKDYYGSEEFLQDYEDSNSGKIPSEIKQGVLSEDSVFDLIGDNYHMGIKLIEIGTKILKNH